MKRAESSPTDSVITRSPFPNSQKVYIKGRLHPIEVAMRSIELSSSAKIQNESLPVYDTSGPYTNPNISLNVKEGLPLLRQEWILSRGDVMELESPTSTHALTQQQDSALDSLRFHRTKKILRAKPGQNV